MRDYIKGCMRDSIKGCMRDSIKGCMRDYIIGDDINVIILHGEGFIWNVILRIETAILVGI